MTHMGINLTWGNSFGNELPTFGNELLMNQKKKKKKKKKKNFFLKYVKENEIKKKNIIYISSSKTSTK